MGARYHPNRLPGLLLLCGWLCLVGPWAVTAAEPGSRQAKNSAAAAPPPGTIPPLAVSPAATSVTDLPLVELPATGPKGTKLAVILTGDGGWAPLVREVGETLARQGVPVVGLNSLRYFWTPRQPEEMGRDLTRILDHYLAVWGKQKAILIGYSRGADALPFMVTRLPGPLRRRITTIALIGPGHSASFEFHLSNWLGGGGRSDAWPLMPEVAKIAGPQILCLHGQEEKDSLCTEPPFPAGNRRAVLLPGGHHFAGDYRHLADLIAAADRGNVSGPPGHEDGAPESK